MENIMSTTFEDGSSLALRSNDEGGFQIFYTSDETEETKWIGMSEEIDYNLAKDIYLLIVKSYAEYDYEEEEDEDEDEEDE